MHTNQFIIQFIVAAWWRKECVSICDEQVENIYNLKRTIFPSWYWTIFDLLLYKQNKESSIFSTWKQEIQSHKIPMTSCTYDVSQLLQANIQDRSQILPILMMYHSSFRPIYRADHKYFLYLWCITAPSGQYTGQITNTSPKFVLCEHNISKIIIIIIIL